MNAELLNGMAGLMFSSIGLLGRSYEHEQIVERRTKLRSALFWIGLNICLLNFQLFAQSQEFPATKEVSPAFSKVSVHMRGKLPIRSENISSRVGAFPSSDEPAKLGTSGNSSTAQAESVGDVSGERAGGQESIGKRFGVDWHSTLRGFALGFSILLVPIAYHLWWYCPWGVAA